MHSNESVCRKSGHIGLEKVFSHHFFVLGQKNIKTNQIVIHKYRPVSVNFIIEFPMAYKSVNYSPQYYSYDMSQFTYHVYHHKMWQVETW